MDGATRGRLALICAIGLALFLGGCDRLRSSDSTPTATPSATPTAASTYVVQRGDTLYAIAVRFGTTTAALSAANHIDDPNVIEVGTVLAVPKPTSATFTGDACDVYTAIANETANLLAQLKSGSSDTKTIASHTDALASELRRLDATFDGADALGDAIASAAVAAAAAGVGRTTEARAAIEQGEALIAQVQAALPDCQADGAS